jgi:hypothetical protein
LVCRYLDAPTEEVVKRVPVALEDEAYHREFRRQIEAATLYRAEISYSIEVPPRGPRLIGVCRDIRIYPAQEGGTITPTPTIPHRYLIRRFVKEALEGRRVEPRRRFGREKRRQLLRVQVAYEAAPPGGKAAAVVRAVLSHHKGDSLGAARQLIFEARAAGILPPAEHRSMKDPSVETEAEGGTYVVQLASTIGEPGPAGMAWTGESISQGQEGRAEGPGNGVHSD